MVMIRNYTIPEFIMNLQDRIYNEMVYQIIKRGYMIKKVEVKEGYLEDDYKIVSNVPKGKKLFIKLIVIVNVIITPAWRFRHDYYLEDYMDE